MCKKGQRMSYSGTIRNDSGKLYAKKTSLSFNFFFSKPHFSSTVILGNRAGNCLFRAMPMKHCLISSFIRSSSSGFQFSLLIKASH